uniref:Uncharacterized protein n=1 Tax=Megaselia scalaris TaxID=36166 RepID=T1GE96_MEGSC
MRATKEAFQNKRRGVVKLARPVEKVLRGRKPSAEKIFNNFFLRQMTLQDTSSCVKTAEGVSEKFQTLRGFQQGDALSCSFFNI